MKTRDTRQSGYSLVEVLIGMTIFAVAMLGLAKVQLATMLGAKTARDVSEATLIAQNKLEELKMTDWSEADWSDTDGDGPEGLSDEGPEADSAQTDLSLRGETYDIYWNVVHDTPAVGNRLVRVIVLWQGRGTPKRVTLDYVGSDMGL